MQLLCNIVASLRGLVCCLFITKGSVSMVEHSVLHIVKAQKMLVLFYKIEVKTDTVALNM